MARAVGVAQYLQQHVLPKLPPDRVAFSGSSGGALVAAALCGDVNIERLTKFVIGCRARAFTCARLCSSL